MAGAVEWRRIGRGVRQVPEPWATPLIWTAAYLGAFGLVGLLSLLGFLDRTGLALLVLSLLAGLLGMRGRFIAAPGTAFLCWTCLNVLGTEPTGELSWAGHRDPGWMACLLAAAVVGTVAGRVLQARAAYRRVTAFDEQA
ncbi:hypothetical protein OKJ48_29625 [Streptomyces kunmingensis]|uniref:Integral membrane protein n=1 Tax=Streptomyces kunmingensis TaxID=68225 RepID=A0ABU6CI03_9ACTN|nr:hypothetical protein [Streptomyces kunmingensis]MEB3964363.1 hypothetical protein [Streptomyces kunmingensis]